MNYDEAFVKMGDAYMNGLGVKPESGHGFPLVSQRC